jgi:hypothetical protein
VTVDNQPPIESAFDVAIKQIAAGTKTLMNARRRDDVPAAATSVDACTPPTEHSVIAFDMALKVAFRVWAATRNEPALEDAKPAPSGFKYLDDLVRAPKLPENVREKAKTTWQVTVSQPLAEAGKANKNGDVFHFADPKFTGRMYTIEDPTHVKHETVGLINFDAHPPELTKLIEPQDTLTLEREGYEPGPWGKDFGGKLSGAGMSLSYDQPIRRWQKPHDPTGKTFFEGGEPKLTVCFDGIEFCSGELRVLGPDAKVTSDHLTALYALEKDEKLSDAKTVTLREFAEMLIQLRWKRHGASVGLNQNLAAALQASPLGRIVLAQHQVPRCAAP